MAETKFKFQPVFGMKTNDSYLHGIGENEDICQEGRIEFVAKDYFILRKENGKAMFVDESDYWVIGEKDFE